MARRSDIQVFRGVAVLAVVLFHGFSTLFPNGYLGVDAFFVISGYVMARYLYGFSSSDKSKTASRQSLLEFYWRRFTRLGPGLGINLSLGILMILFLVSPDEHMRVVKQGFASLFLVANLSAYKYSGNYFSSQPNPLVHTWSLSVEEQFYLIMPLLFLMMGYFNFKEFRIRLTIFLISILSVVVFSFPNVLLPVYSSLGFPDAAAANFYFPFGRIWEFCAGCIIWRSAREGKISLPTGKVKILAAQVIGLGILFSPFQLAPLYSSLDICSIGLVLLSQSVTIKNICKPLIWLGDRSYSIYLLHMPIIICGLSFLNFSQEEVSFWWSAIFITLTLSISSVIYASVEKPLRELGRTRPTKYSFAKIFVTSFVVPSTFLLVLAFAHNSHLWPQKSDESRTPVFATTTDKKCQVLTDFGPPCMYMSGSNKETVLLIGDSHAAQYASTVKKSARQLGYNLVIWTHHDCPLLAPTNSESNANCKEINNKRLKIVERISPGKLVVSMNVTENSNIRSMVEALKALRTKQNARGGDVLLIGNNPVFPGNTFQISPPLFNRNEVDRKDFMLNEMNHSADLKSTNLLTKARQSNILVVNPSPIFCADNRCVRWREGNWLYVDATHLSISGAELLAPAISEYLRK
jgi:peptidoglycan/LPS O-acetylase OafA/YrhL